MNNVRIIRFKRVCELLGISPSTLWDWLRKTSPRFDPTIPPRVRMGKRAVGFVEADMLAWIVSKKSA